MVHEDLRDGQVGEVTIHVHALREDVLTDRLRPALLPPVERLVEAAADEAGVLELLQVAREHRAEELALPEDPDRSLAPVDDGQSGQIAAQQRPRRLQDGVLASQERGITQQRLADGTWTHGNRLTGT